MIILCFMVDDFWPWGFDQWYLEEWCHPDNVKNTESLWVWSSEGEVPPNAVPGGFDEELLYIGRSVHKKALIPGKINKSEGVCCVTWRGTVHKISEYEDLHLRYSCFDLTSLQDQSAVPFLVVGHCFFSIFYFYFFLLSDESRRPSSIFWF
ncbi:uncharacterized protein LOC142321769 isoform X2 [Lycorma delicatula]|uniref:uncharacterized protein LOC142321769 isoform X2 n=1 Tax=Lycorma delicatula TaxID=130591 RepID=UPI003F5130BF